MMNKEEKEKIDNIHQIIKPLKKSINKIFRNNQFSEDILQETLLVCLMKYNSLKNEKLLLPWAITIAKNIGFHLLRNDDKIDYCDEVINTKVDEKDLEQIQQIYNGQKIKAIIQLFEKLPETQRKIAIDYYLYGIAREEICKSYKISKSIFDSRLYRARDRLRKFLMRIHKNENDKKIVNEFNDLLKGEYSMDQIRIEISQSLVSELIVPESNIINFIKNQRIRFKNDFRIDIPQIHIIDNEYLKKDEYIISIEEKRISEGRIEEMNKLKRMNEIIRNTLTEYYSK